MFLYRGVGQSAERGLCVFLTLQIPVVKLIIFFPCMLSNYVKEYYIYWTKI